MKKIFGFLLMAALVSVISCKSDKPSQVENAEVPGVNEGEELEDQKTIRSYASIFNVDVQNSVIRWKGSKALGDFHEGTLKLSSGRMAMNHGALIAGEMVIDMKSIDILEMEGEMKEKLLGHLKSADFFDVENHASGEFKFSQIQPVEDGEGINYTVKGPLVLKDKENVITIPANVVLEGENMRVTSPTFTINRTLWDVNYNSSILGTIKDKLINDDIELSFDLIATPRD